MPELDNATGQAVNVDPLASGATTMCDYVSAVDFKKNVHFRKQKIMDCCANCSSHKVKLNFGKPAYACVIYGLILTKKQLGYVCDRHSR